MGAAPWLLEPVTNSALPVSCSHCSLFFIACIRIPNAHVIICLRSFFPPDHNINSMGCCSFLWAPHDSYKCTASFSQSLPGKSLPEGRGSWPLAGQLSSALTERRVYLSFPVDPSQELLSLFYKKWLGFQQAPKSLSIQSVINSQRFPSADFVMLCVRCCEIPIVLFKLLSSWFS